MKPLLSRFTFMVALGLTATAHAADVGRVLLAAGNAVAIRGNQTVSLTYGAIIQDKDLLRTGAASNLQVRFIDESIVSLKENSELRIDDFRFSGKEDGSERGFLSLLKGGLRTVTGLVGRANHANYRLSTTTATIGIRGTDYAATLCQGDCRNSDGSLAKDGLYGRTNGISHGTNRIDVSNERDQKSFGINENFYVADAKSIVEPLLVAPDFVSNKLESRKQGGTKSASGGSGSEQATTGGAASESRPSTTPEPLPQLQFVATQDLGPQGTSLLLTPTYGIAGADNGDAGGAQVFPSQLTLSGTTLIGLDVTGTDGDGPFHFIGTTTLAAVVDTGSGTGVDVHWGRWSSGTLNDNGVVRILDVAPNGHFHYIYGELTPQDTIAAKTGTAVFNRIGGTTPTDSLSPVNTASSFSFGSIGVNFTTRTAVLSSLSMAFPTGVNYNFSSVPLQINLFGGGASIEGSTTNPTGCSGGPCITSAPATLKVDGAFIGPTGNHIGAVFGTQSVAGTTASAQLFKCPTCP